MLEEAAGGVRYELNIVRYIDPCPMLKVYPSDPKEDVF